MKHAFLVVAAIAGFCITLAQYRANMFKMNVNTSRALSVKTRTAKLGDGCYHIFLDVGANVGVHARFLMEPSKYPLIHPKTSSIFAKYFWTPNWDCRDICVFAFEPNPNHKKRHEELAKAYHDVGIRYHHIGAGVGDLEGSMTFYHKGDESHNEWGFSTTNTPGQRGNGVQIPVIRLKKWLEDNIYNRTIPEPIGVAMKDVPPRVVMKIDVEGAEYSMLPDLMMSGILCKTVDYIFGEYHPFGSKVEPNPKTGRGGLDATKYMNYDQYALALFDTIKSLRNDDCKLEAIDWHDDEMYYVDNVALPEKMWWTPKES